MTKKQLKSGEWAEPVMRGYKESCCDCGLTHIIDYIVIDDKTGKLLSDVSVVYRAYRLETKKKRKKNVK